jgi:hypothetical protein
MPKLLRVWLPLAILATIMSGLVYAAVQQNYRQSANDPQIQMVEAAAAALAMGQSAQVLVPSQVIDISQSLLPYMMVFDESHRLTASSAVLNGQPPNLPSGVFDVVKQRGEAHFTWQPRLGVRSAVVMKHYNGGYVLAGRNLREVENREGQLTLMVSLGWLVAMGGTFAAVAILK